MIKTEHPYNGNEARVYTYSDEGFKIRQAETGETYDDADDEYPCKYTYTETDIPIITEMTTEEMSKKIAEHDQIINTMLGVN